MRLCNNAIFAVLLAGAALSLAAQQRRPGDSVPPGRQAPLTVDRDPVRSPDSEPGALPVMRKQGTGYVLHTDVEEVVLNCTVLDGNRWFRT